MDPFSLTVGAAGLLSLVASIIKVARPFLSSSKETRDSAATLLAELEAIDPSLRRLDQILARRGSEFGNASALRATLSSFESNLSALNLKLHQIQESKTRRLLWPLAQDEHLRSIQRIRAFGSWIQFALSLDQCDLLTRTSDDVLDVLQQQIETIRAFKTVDEGQKELRDAIENQSKLLQDNLDIEAHRNLCAWISQVDPKTKHRAVRAPRLKHTGEWLLQLPEYRQWKDGSASHTLWCHGVQGSGKSVLASLIIDQLAADESPKRPLAFTYVDYRDEQTTREIVASLLQQVLILLPIMPSVVHEAYHNTNGVELSLDELIELFVAVVSSLDGIFVVIDALDELPRRADVLQFLKTLQSTGRAKILVTSRPHPQDIGIFLGSYPQIEIIAHDSDLRQYMLQEFHSICDAGIVSFPFAEDLINKLVRESHGLFLLAVLQLRSIISEPTAGEMEDALQQVSKTLSGAPADTISRVRRLPEARKRLAFKTLQWTCHTEKLFHFEDLTEALSVRSDQHTRNPKYRPSITLLIEVCQGLVIVDSMTGVVRLAHHSVQEYLLQESGEKKLHQQAEIAEICLTYLLFDEFKVGPCSNEDRLMQRLSSHPLFEFAARNVGIYASAAALEPRVAKLIKEFLRCPGAVASCLQAVRYCKLYRYRYWSSEESWSQTALHAAAYYNFKEEANEILRNKDVDVNARTVMGSTAAIIAAARGNGEILQLLLSCGADPNLENWYGNALHCAAEGGSVDSIQILLRSGMDTSARRLQGSTPLHCTVDNNNDRAADALIAGGAKILEYNKRGHTVFHLAVAYGCRKIVDLLLTKWKVNPDHPTRGGPGRPSMTPLEIAQRAGNLWMSTRLLDAGATGRYASYSPRTTGREQIEHRPDDHDDEASVVQGLRPLSIDSEE